MGVLTGFAGAMVMAIAADIIHVPEESIHVPRWLMGLIGFMFFYAGSVFAAPKRYRKKLVRSLGPVILGVLLITATWIAIGPGERECSTSIDWIGTSESTGISCRIVPGIGALLMALIFVHVIRSMFKGEKKNKENKDE